MKFSRYKKGFGLLEVAISGAIITIILSSLVVLGRSSLTSSEVAAERSEATYLAQKGIETVRQIRDTNWIDKNANTDWNSLCWDASLPVDQRIGECGIYGDLGKYQITYIGDPVQRYLLQTEPATPVTERHDNISYTTTVQLFQPAPSSTTSILPTNSDTGNDVVGADNGLVVEVTVSWRGQSATEDRKVTVRELLTNWRPNY